jgi:hypothetical protein
MRGVLGVFVGDVMNKPVLRNFQGVVGQVLAGAEKVQVVDQGFEHIEELGVQLLMFFEPRETVLLHEGLLSPKVAVGVVSQERHAFLDSLFSLAIQNAVVESMRCLEECLVLLIDLCDSDEVIF